MLLGATNNVPPAKLLSKASARDQAGLSKAYQEHAIESNRRQNQRRSNSVLYGGNGVPSTGIHTVEELDRWMAAITAELAPMEVKRTIFEGRVAVVCVMLITMGVVLTLGREWLDERDATLRTSSYGVVVLRWSSFGVPGLLLSDGSGQSVNVDVTSSLAYRNVNWERLTYQKLRMINSCADLHRCLGVPSFITDFLIASCCLLMDSCTPLNASCPSIIR